MGHSFLVIAEQSGRFLDARYFQYGFRMPEKLHKDPAPLVSFRSIPFRMESGQAWDFIHTYTNDDRIVQLFEVDLSEDQIQLLIEKAETEQHRRTAFIYLDYSLFSNNCETKILDLINSVIPEHLVKFDYIPFSQQGFFSMAFRDPAQVSMTVPMGAARYLETHPMIKGKHTFYPRNLVQLKTLLVGFEVLKPLFDRCGTSKDTREIVRQLYGNPVLRHSQEYLNILKAMFSECAIQHGLVLTYNKHLDFLRMDTEDKDFLKLSGSYYLRP